LSPESCTGVAALSVREVARSVGIRHQSLTHYFPTKQDFLDSMFSDGFADLKPEFDRLGPQDDLIEGVADVAVAFVDYCVANPHRYHLMIQGTVPGFEPSGQSHQVALGVLGVLIVLLAAAGVVDDGDVALVRCVISGLAAEQIANDPQGRICADQTRRAIRHLPQCGSRQEHLSTDDEVIHSAGTPPNLGAQPLISRDPSLTGQQPLTLSRHKVHKSRRDADPAARIGSGVGPVHHLGGGTGQREGGCPSQV
jgi:AcrR family transcriptional regulator